MKINQSDIERMKQTRDVKSLIEALAGSTNESIRVLAADALGDLRDVESVEALAQAALWDESQDVRSVAHEALETILGNQAETVLDTYRQQQPKVFRKYDGEKVFYENPLEGKEMDALIDILSGDGSRNNRVLAAKALGDLGDVEGVEALAMAALWDKSEQVRSVALDALIGILGNQTESVLENYRANPPEDAGSTISEDEEDEEDEKDSSWSEDELRGLIMVLEGEPNLEIKLKAVRALEKIGDNRVTQALARATYVDEEPRLQMAARKALENIFGEHAEQYIDSVRRMDLGELEEEDEEIGNRDEEDEGDEEDTEEVDGEEEEETEEEGDDESAAEPEPDEVPAVVRRGPAQSVYNRQANQTPVVEWDDPRKRILLPLLIGLIVLGIIVAAVVFLR